MPKAVEALDTVEGNPFAVDWCPLIDVVVEGWSAARCVEIAGAEV